MKIDLHIHSKDCSDGKMDLPGIIREARNRGVGLMSITDHDSIDCQESIGVLAHRAGIAYITGVELSISFAHPPLRGGKPVSLDLLGYQFDPLDPALNEKLEQVREFRRHRAQKILEKLNLELKANRLEPLKDSDIRAIEESVDGAYGRPHIANYLVRKGIVKNRQAAFDQYLVKCNVPKMPVSLEEASSLVRGAGGRIVLAHPNDPNGTSLASLTPSVEEQLSIIKTAMLPHLDGIECWHSRHDRKTIRAYAAFCEKEGLLVTGGSDCHQQPVIIGKMDVPHRVADQFDIHLSEDSQ